MTVKLYVRATNIRQQALQLMYSLLKRSKLMTQQKNNQNPMYFKPVPDRLYGVLHGVNELRKCEEIWKTRLKVSK